VIDNETEKTKIDRFDEIGGLSSAISAYRILIINNEFPIQNT